MEDQIAKILKIIDDKKIIIEKETFAGGCAAVPTYTVSIKHNGNEISEKTLVIEDAIDKILSQIEE
ncbi:MAG: hypothetical protein KAT05_00650 [Spirochaetes bacterium]|nr:hypothetical protein [Spirochaetota bacterium]